MKSMKEFYISECARHENKIITSNFVVVSKQIKPKKTGEPYLALILGDRSGQLDAKMWDNVEEVLNAFEQDDFLKIKAWSTNIRTASSSPSTNYASWANRRSNSPTIFLKPQRILTNC